MRFLIFVAVPALLLLFVSGCSGKSGKTDKDASASSTDLDAKILAKMKINEDTPDILYTYAKEDGAYVTVDAADKVPDPFRNDVIVINLNLPPEERGSDTRVVVADLNAFDGEYFSVHIEERGAFEAAQRLRRQWKLTQIDALGSPGAPGVPPGSPGPVPQASGSADGVTLYGTSWCGYCRKVREFLRKNKVPFVEKDIEKDPAAAAELQAFCRSAGTACSGVPVVNWKGALIQGYDVPRMQRLMQTPPRPPNAPPPSPPGP